MYKKAKTEKFNAKKEGQRVAIIISEIAQLLRPYKISEEDGEKIVSLLHAGMMIKSNAEKTLAKQEEG